MPAHWAEFLLFAVYFLAGPGMWIIFPIGLYQARKRMNLIRQPRDPVPNPPLVTILIPAKDEGERISDCIKSALNQDYANFHVVAVDDRSTDQTGKILDEIAAGDPRLTVVHI